MQTSQKEKRCYFFCYEGAVEAKNVRKNVKCQDFGLDTFLVKGSNMENIATSVRTENVRSGIFQIFNIGYILMSFTYFSFLPICCRESTLLKLFCSELQP